MQFFRFVCWLSLPGIFLISGCSLMQIDEESKQIENRGVIKGDIYVANDTGAPVRILLFRIEKESIVLVNTYSLQGEGMYRFYVPPETYYIAAYQDLNKDGLYQRSEAAAIYGGTSSADAKPITIKVGDKVKLATLTVARPLVSDKKTDNLSFEIKGDHTGEVVSLDNPKFEQEVSSLGLWQPITFLEQHGVGLYLLQPYSPNLTPVIFIHGAGGDPRNFSMMIDSLDRNNYQPWVLHYPSGISLDIVSDYLVRSINKLHAQYQFKQFSLVAHSMGGLVLRSTVMKYQNSEHEAKITSAMTINSPMMGMASAAAGVVMSPIVVSSWRDVAEGSQFIDDVISWPWPKNIPYYLVFSYETGEGDDGVVSLESQIPVSLQEEATKLYGFNAGHASALSDADFISLFKRLMEPKLHQSNNN